LTCKNKLDGGSEIEKVFQNLMTALVMAAILIHPNFLKPSYIKTDLTIFALGAIFL